MDVAKFGVGQRVYRKIAPDMLGMVTGVIFRESHVEYLATFSENDCEHTYQALELTTEPNFVLGGAE